MQALLNRLKIYFASPGMKIAAGLAVTIIAVLLAMLLLFPSFQAYLAGNVYGEPFPKDNIMYEDATEFLKQKTSTKLLLPYLWLTDKFYPNAFLHLSELGEYLEVKEIFSYARDSGGTFRVKSVNAADQTVAIEVVAPRWLYEREFTGKLACQTSLTMIYDERQSTLTPEQKQEMGEIADYMILAKPRPAIKTALQELQDLLSLPEARDGSYGVYIIGRCSDIDCAYILPGESGGCEIAFIKEKTGE